MRQCLVRQSLNLERRVEGHVDKRFARRGNNSASLLPCNNKKKMKIIQRHAHIYKCILTSSSNGKPDLEGRKCWASSKPSVRLIFK